MTACEPSDLLAVPMTACEPSDLLAVPMTASTAYSQLYSELFRAFSDITGSTRLLRQHLHTDDRSATR